MSKNIYDESKNYSKTIFSDMIKLFDKKKIKYKVKKNSLEVAVMDTEMSRDSMYTYISTNLNIPKLVTLLLLKVIEINSVIYIRQNTI